MNQVYTIEQLFKATKGTLIKVVHKNPIEHLLIDSRKLHHAATSIFFAINGIRNNGHQFIEELYNKGVRNFVIEQDVDYSKFSLANFILVANAIKALQQITAIHRQKFNYPVIGITGSNGKTVVKEWLYQLLQKKHKIIRSPRSYNSQIGVPLSVWPFSNDYNLAIIEAGISQPNEMINLEKIIKPTIGVFTNIGEAHGEGFLNIRQKINEKLQLFAFAKHIVYCRDYDELNNAIITFRAKVQQDEINDRFIPLCWSIKSEADLRILKMEQPLPNCTKITGIYKGSTTSITIPFTDSASIENAINCWLILLLLEWSNADINKGFAQLVSVGMRLELKEANNNCSLINDSYSNDISSLTIALDFLAQQNQHAKKTVILSDILQSGKNDIDLYALVVELIHKKNINKIIGIGKAIGRQAKYFQALEGVACYFYDSTSSFISNHSFSEFQNEVILLKGARIFEFEKISKLFERKAHETVLEVNLSAVAYNLKIYQGLIKPSTKIMAMVKAFSYGSGSFEIANLLQFNKVDYLAVAYADEGVALRQAGILLPIMVMCPENSSLDTLIKNNLEPEIFSLPILNQLLDVLQLFESQSPRLPVAIHLKLDTGMKRLGFEQMDLEIAVQTIKEYPHLLKVASVFTHLAASENSTHDAFTESQFALFNKWSNYIEDELGYPVLKHCLNSAGIVRHGNQQHNMVRLGIGLYGVEPIPQKPIGLKFVSTLKTAILQIKEVRANDTVGYSRLGSLPNGGKIATVGIGYADGLHRSLGNGAAQMFICGQLASTVGNICMDLCMLDISHIPQAKVGDEVIVFGNQPTITQLAEWQQTISYEVLTNISSRVKRIYFEE
jgi:alanine racemase